MSAPSPGETMHVVDTAGLAPVRRALAAAAAAVVGAERAADIELAASELMTNALEHGDQPQVVVRHDADGDAYVVAVTSSSDARPTVSAGSVPSDQEAGRGLQIVHALADDVVIESSGRESTVICRFGPLAG